MGSIIHPFYFRIIKRDSAGWRFREGKVFYNPRAQPLDPEQIESRDRDYGLSDVDIVVELFRINGGKAGYYLVNLRDRKYYYCGEDWESIRTTLRSLGIGRDDPMEGK
ncbi:hypothetical protein IFO70_10340 [Phormidium tenue FACHB-886]|nr:hypothetical protein [Phormidium tenue FACHB-886]